MPWKPCGTTRHIELQGHSAKALKWRKASWVRVLREGITGGLMMLIPTLLLGFFLSWQIGLAVIGTTAGAATLSSVFFALRGHTLACAAKKGFVLTLGWWERI